MLHVARVAQHLLAAMAVRGIDRYGPARRMAHRRESTLDDPPLLEFVWLAVGNFWVRLRASVRASVHASVHACVHLARVQMRFAPFPVRLRTPIRVVDTVRQW
jgi:hypothetical protein